MTSVLQRFPRFQVASIGLLLFAAACTDRAENDPDRRPGPQPELVMTNAREGSPNGRGISPATGPAMTIDGKPLTTIEDIVSAPNQVALTSRTVQLNAVPVQRVLSSQYLIVGSSDDRGVVVRLKEPLRNLQPGQRINVTGMIAQTGVDLAHWELDEDKKQMVRGYAIFVSAVSSAIAQ